MKPFNYLYLLYLFSGSIQPSFMTETSVTSTLGSRHWNGHIFLRSTRKVRFLSIVIAKLFIHTYFLLAVAERPQHMLMRVAVGIHGENIEKAIEVNNYE